MHIHELKVEENFAGKRLDIFLAQVLPDCPSRTFVKKLIDEGHVQVNQGQQKAHYKVVPQDVVRVSIPDQVPVDEKIKPENIPLDIFYEDEALIVINKSSGMLVHPARGVYSGTLVNALLYHGCQLSDVNSLIRPGIVHRLDLETSGLIVVAKNNLAHVNLSRQFEKRRVKKRYVALVEGLINFDEGLIDVGIKRHIKFFDKKMVAFDDDAKKSQTIYRVLKRFKKHTLVALFPKTGRTHQLRVHMAHLGHPILGDEKYGNKNTFHRLALHAQGLGFFHPSKLKFIEFSCSIPEEMGTFVD